MIVLHIRDLLGDPILISRESARLLERPLAELLKNGAGREDSPPTQVTLDFQGVEGIAPSFLDELITICESLLESQDPDRKPRLIIAHPPTRLSLKFQAVARGHAMSAVALDDGTWQLTPAPLSSS